MYTLVKAPNSRKRFMMLVSLMFFVSPFYFGGLLRFVFYFASVSLSCITLIVEHCPFPSVSVVTVFFQKWVAMTLQQVQTFIIQRCVEVADFGATRQDPLIEFISHLYQVLQLLVE